MDDKWAMMHVKKIINDWMWTNGFIITKDVAMGSINNMMIAIRDQSMDDTHGQIAAAKQKQIDNANDAAQRAAKVARQMMKNQMRKS